MNMNSEPRPRNIEATTEIRISTDNFFCFLAPPRVSYLRRVNLEKLKERRKEKRICVVLVDFQRGSWLKKGHIFRVPIS